MLLIVGPDIEAGILGTSAGNASGLISAHMC